MTTTVLMLMSMADDDTDDDARNSRAGPESGQVQAHEGLCIGADGSDAMEWHMHVN